MQDLILLNHMQIAAINLLELSLVTWDWSIPTFYAISVSVIDYANREATSLLHYLILKLYYSYPSSFYANILLQKLALCICIHNRFGK
jgi:hypothetical protein